MIKLTKLNKIKTRIAKEFPEFKGIEPKIVEKRIEPQSNLFRKLSLGTPKQYRKIFRLRFKKEVKTANHMKLEKILTVTLDEQGEIIKITESK